MGTSWGSAKQKLAGARGLPAAEKTGWLRALRRRGRRSHDEVAPHRAHPPRLLAFLYARAPRPPLRAWAAPPAGAVVAGVEGRDRRRGLLLLTFATVAAAEVQAKDRLPADLVPQNAVLYSTRPALSATDQSSSYMAISVGLHEWMLSSSFSCEIRSQA